jgi:predicted NAD/FAD-binding protein
VRAACPVMAVKRHVSSGKAVEIHSSQGIEQFDAVIMACHSDQALALLSDASPAETALLGSIRYQPNRAVLHADVRLLPQQGRCWAAWNYFSAEGGAEASPVVGVSYLLNKLQPLPTTQPIVVTLNPVEEPQADTVFAEFDYAHPVFDRAAIDAQQCIDTIQGKQGTWFAGAWLGYGFHEDGLKAGLRAADLLWTSQYESRG